MTKIKNLTFINSYDVAPHDYCNRMIARFEEIANKKLIEKKNPFITQC